MRLTADIVANLTSLRDHLRGLDSASGEAALLTEAISRLSTPSDAQIRNEALEECHDIAMAIDSGRGNEKEIAKAIRTLKTPVGGA